MSGEGTFYVPLPNYEVKLAVSGEGEEEVAVVEEYIHPHGWVVYVPKTRTKLIVPAALIRPVSSPSADPAGRVINRRSQVSGPESWWHQAKLEVVKSPSSWSRCQGCRMRIELDRLRLGIVEKYWNGKLYIKKHWFHLRCFRIGLIITVDSIERFAGHTDLSETDRALLQRHLACPLDPRLARPMPVPPRGSYSLPSQDSEMELITRFASACRNVVARFVSAFKREVFLREGTKLAACRPDDHYDDEPGDRVDAELPPEVRGVRLVCPVTKVEMSWAESHVHHDWPDFDEIQSAFVQLHKVDVRLVRYSMGTFVDQSLAHDFYEYHRDRCNLRVVHKSANLSILKKRKTREDAHDGSAQKRRRKGKEVVLAECDGCHLVQERTVLLTRCNRWLCRSCRLRSYSSSTRAKQLYRLNQEDLATIGHEEVPNPISVNFAPMKLYLKRDLLLAARRKHGPQFQPPSEERREVTQASAEADAER